MGIWALTTPTVVALLISSHFTCTTQILQMLKIILLNDTFFMQTQTGTQIMATAEAMSEKIHAANTTPWRHGSLSNTTPASSN